MEILRHQMRDMKYAPEKSTILSEIEIMKADNQREAEQKYERAKRITKRKTCFETVKNLFSKR